jgi:Zn-dependent protease
VQLLEPTPTRFDLSWRMFGIPVRVHPMFWLVTVLMGASLFRQGVQYVLVWVACVFVSILIHEMGHVLMGMAFGARGNIVLYGFGGLAVGSNNLERRGERIAVCFAGPLAGFVFLGLIMLVLWIVDAEAFPLYVLVVRMQLGLPPDNVQVGETIPHPLLIAAIGDLIFINLMWGLVNLLPIWPLDGGQISRELWLTSSPEQGLTRSLGLSMVVAALFAINSVLVMIGRPLLPWHIGSWYSALLFASLALQSYQLMQRAHAEQRWRDSHYDDGYGNDDRYDDDR